MILRDESTTPMAAAPPLSPIQQRVTSALQDHEKMRAERRSNGGPEDMPEIDRELTMCRGAIDGVNQRVGELVAKLQPLLPEHVIPRILDTSPGPVRSDSHFEITTEVGARIRDLQVEVSQLETVIENLLAVRL